MALPSIAPYAMPGRGDVPASRLPWGVDPRRAVLLVHDMQHHFLSAYPPASPLVEHLVDNIGALRVACDEADVPVVFSAQPEEQSPAERGLQLDLWGTGIAAGHGDIVDALSPSGSDHRLTKWRYSAFLHTELADLLAHWGRDQLVVTGIYAHIGCMTTTTEAFMRDVQAFLVADAVADFSLSDHLMALHYVARRSGGRHDDRRRPRRARRHPRRECSPHGRRPVGLTRPDPFPSFRPISRRTPCPERSPTRSTSPTSRPCSPAATRTTWSRRSPPTTPSAPPTGRS